MYVRTYVCMHVCMYVCNDVCMYVCMYVCMCLCMCMCVCVCVCVCVLFLVFCFTVFSCRYPCPPLCKYSSLSFVPQYYDVRFMEDVLKHCFLSVVGVKLVSTS